MIKKSKEFSTIAEPPSYNEELGSWSVPRFV